ncbi:transposase [Chitinophagaceae bacterium IBVUCB2]|nr:transposase [Chitinophagaceae bacterium IBVUCB2]
MKQNYRCYNLQSLCGLFGYSRQAFYKQQRLQIIEQSRDALILQQVLHIRNEQPRCGTRKLLVMLQPFFKKQDIQIGRDTFFQLLAQNKLLIRKRKRSTHTTNSKHFFYRYPNLVAHFTPLHAHELWVADITYIPMKERFAYLYLLTDAYSRKIVGFHVSDDMRVTSAIVALQKALDQKPADAIVIHHSDRGLQYCSNDYVAMLKAHHARISMTQNGDPYENAMAERVNGILKSELISDSYPDLKAAMQHIARCITIYNYRRVHSSLNWQIPDKVHTQQGPQIKKWKNYYKTKKLKQQAMS